MSKNKDQNQFQRGPKVQIKQQEESAVSCQEQSQKSSKKTHSLAQFLHAFNNRITAEEEINSAKRYDPRNRYTPINKKRSCSDLLPTHRQVKQSLDLLKSILPKQNIKDVVGILYKNLVRRNQNGQERAQIGIEQQLVNERHRIGGQKHFYRNSSVLQLQNNIRSLGKLDNTLNCSKTFPKDENYKQKFKKPIEQQKYNKKHLIAEVIFKVGYGVAALDQEITRIKSNLKIDRMEYKTTAFSVATETYRKIQQFLTKQCSKKIKPINREELRSIFRIILNCRVYFQQQDVKTMLKFISAVYGLTNVTITGMQAMKLYRSIQQKLKIKLTYKYIQPINREAILANKTYKFKNQDQSNILQLEQVWNKDFETELLQVYKVDQSFSHIRDYFVKFHPENKQSFTSQSIRSKFGKIIRAALRKVTNVMSKNTRFLPTLTKLNDLRIKLIQRSPEGLKLRFDLIDFYLSRGEQLDQVKEIILTINDYVQMKEKEIQSSKKYLIDNQSTGKDRRRNRYHNEQLHQNPQVQQYNGVQLDLQINQLEFDSNSQ